MGGHGKQIVATRDETLGREMFETGVEALGRDAAAVSDDAVERRLRRRREGDRGAGMP